MNTRMTVITGGIGAGKSVVSRVLRVLGYEVFDCDAEAKDIMDSDDVIKRRLATEISPDVIRHDGTIDRQHLSDIVFTDPEKLSLLNSIVHAAVLRLIDLRRKASGAPRFFVETAILYQSGIDAMADDVWEVIAPEEIRILRVIGRNNCSRQSVIDRMRSQIFVPDAPHPMIYTIVNDDFQAVLPQILALL